MLPLILGRRSGSPATVKNAPRHGLPKGVKKWNGKAIDDVPGVGGRYARARGQWRC
jgi:hypothetical protein